MGEIEFIEEIEDSLKKGTYEDLLCGSELKLKNLFERYIPEDVLTLINATIIFHNFLYDCFYKTKCSHNKIAVMTLSVSETYVYFLDIQNNLFPCKSYYNYEI